MKNDETQVIQMKEFQILESITDPIRIANMLYQQECLTISQLEEIKNKCTSRDKCRHMLDVISSDTSHCVLDDFIEVLSLSDAHLVDLANAIAKTADDRGVSRARSRRENLVYEKVRKVNVYTNSRRRVEAVGNTLKRLSHDGDKTAFEGYVKRIEKVFQRNERAQNINITRRMELADLHFTCLENKIVLMRVYYDKSLVYKHPVFRQLLKLIPKTSNPTVTSMTYLARYGSALSMSVGIEAGLTTMQYSKHHAENIVPCRESGMVYYIEINLLFQLYEQNPTESMKKRILSTAELAISQFVDEEESVKNDYKRMLLLKMVFCRLGIGLFGNRITGAVVSKADLHSARNYLDFIERPEIWEGMEARRKMLFHLAKAEFFKLHDQSDLAVVHAREAHTLATEKHWKAELPHIHTLLYELEAALETNNLTENNPTDIDELEAIFGNLES